jgi:hypothetical protein
MSAPPDITIGRLVLDVPGLAPGDAGRLAEMVAAHLARGAWQAGDTAIPRVAIALEDGTLEDGALEDRALQDGAADMDALASQIARHVRARMG